MKSYIGIVIGVALLAGTVQAQQALPARLVQPEDLAAAFQPRPFKKASDNIHLLSAKDFTLQRPTDAAFLASQMQGIRALCPYLQQPVVLELEASRKDQENAWLHWKAENALNGTRYIIERSFDDTLHFETTGYALPQASYASKEEYQLPDANHYDRLSYYRVKLELSSGTALYSNIAAVKGYTLQQYQVFPNPARDWVNLLANNNHDAVRGVKILDGTGKTVWQRSGLRNKTFYQERVNIAGFTSGMYLVTFDMADNSQQTLVFIKQ